MEYFVEYLENDVLNADIWSQRLLDEELTKGEVKIIHIEPAYHILVQLGLAEE